MFVVHALCFALVAQLVEHTLGKGEVSGSNPLKSSIAKGRYENICLCLGGPALRDSLEACSKWAVCKAYFE